MRYPLSLFRPLFFLLLLCLPATSWAVIYTWNGSVDNDWTKAANWTPDNGIPGTPTASDQVIINACNTSSIPHCPALGENRSVNKLTMQHVDGKLNIAYHTLTVHTLYILYGSINSSAGTITISSYVQDLRYCTFVGNVTINTGSNDASKSNGGNTYLNDVIFNHSAGDFINGNNLPNTFNGEVVINVSNSANVHVSFFSTSTFHQSLTINNISGLNVSLASSTNSKIICQGELIINNTASAGNVVVSTGGEFGGAVTIKNGANARQTGFNGTCSFNGPVKISHLNTRAYTPSSHHLNLGITFGTSTTKTTFNENATLEILPEPNGFTGGGLYLHKVEFKNALALTSLVLTAGSLLQIGTGSSFAGPVNLVAPHILLSGTTFSKETTLEKTALTNVYMSANNGGGNKFNGATSIKNTGGGLWYFGQYAVDLFNEDLSVQHSGGNGTYIAHWLSGHKFRGDLTLTLAAGATGVIQLGGAGGTSEQTTETGNKTLTVNASSGNIRIGGFTQRGASAPVFSLTTTPNSTASLTLGSASLFEAPITLSTPQLFLNGATFNQQSSFIKTGSGSNNSTGGNVFKGKVTISNLATSGLFNTALQTDDLINQ